MPDQARTTKRFDNAARHARAELADFDLAQLPRAPLLRLLAARDNLAALEELLGIARRAVDRALAAHVPETQRQEPA